EPYCAKIFRQRWYLVAQSPYYNAIRIYSLDRIQNLQTTDKGFRLPEDFCSETYFENAFGIIVEEEIKPYTIHIKAFGNKSKYLLTLPLHHSQKEIKTSEDESVFTVFLSPTFDFKQELLSHGNEIEVTSPDWFREEMKEVINKMNERYHY
ncbi:MAG: WYL domain-containing protein, partial [Prevotellaceae bacterium]|nr:WYL domain-containing protein [Prevotellaceae bacterium]